MTATVTAADATDEVQQLFERFGAALGSLFDEPAGECPVCRGTVDQLTLTLNLAGVGQQIACTHCGAVLAA